MRKFIRHPSSGLFLFGKFDSWEDPVGIEILYFLRDFCKARLTSFLQISTELLHK